LETGGNISPDQHNPQPPRAAQPPPPVNEDYYDYHQDDYEGGEDYAPPVQHYAPRPQPVQINTEFTPEETRYYTFKLERGRVVN